MRRSIPFHKIILKSAKLFGQDPRTLFRLASAYKAPPIIRDDAEKFLRWCDMHREHEVPPDSSKP